MIGLEALHSVQYVSAKGKRFAVVSLEDWELLLEWLETVEDTAVTQQAYETLQAAGGNRERAGWIKWEDVKEELG